MTRPTKRIVFSCGGKGGVGKTTVATAIADYYATRAIPAVLFDCDTENKSRGSLSHFFPQATKLDIRSERGLDHFVDAALAAGASVALADLAAGSGRDTFHWFDTMWEALVEEGISFAAVATITSAASSVETLFTWADALRDRVSYLVVKNHVAGDDFGYLDRTEPGREFLTMANPVVIHLEVGAREIASRARQSRPYACAGDGCGCLPAGCNSGQHHRTWSHQGVRAAVRCIAGVSIRHIAAVNDAGQFPDSVYDRIAAFLPPELRTSFYRYVAHVKTLRPDDDFVVIIQGMGILALLARQIPEALAEERGKLLTEFAQLCRKHETVTGRATDDVRTMFSAHQKLLEQIGRHHTVEQEKVDVVGVQFTEEAVDCHKRFFFFFDWRTS